MRLFCTAGLVVLALGATAAAQPAESPSASFLESRVREELAVEGLVLSRRDLGLQIEQLADRWQVSLVDLTTGRVAASTRVDTLPADREAAVAAMTRVVAELATRIEPHPAAPPTPPSPPAPLAAPALALTLPPPPESIAERAQHAPREIAELAFQRDSLRFGPGVGQRWSVYQGPVQQELDPVEFYAKVGRPELGASYTSRRTLMFGSFIATGAVVVLGIAIAIGQRAEPLDCPITLDTQAFAMCLDRESHSIADADRNRLIALSVTAGLTTIGLTTGFWYLNHPQPIDDNAAKELADAYNHQLRRRLGLPVVSRRPLLHDVRLTPYAARGGAGLVLGARF
jgi:hypothetical protein